MSDSSTRPASVQNTIKDQTPIAVTVKQAARLLGTNVRARELPVVRFGNSYSIAVDDLRAWFNRKKGVL